MRCVLLATLIIALFLTACGGGSTDPSPGSLFGIPLTEGGDPADPADPVTPADPPATPPAPPAPPAPGASAPVITLVDTLSSDSSDATVAATVSDGTGFSWVLVNGPGPVVFDPSDAASTTVSVAVGGSYTLRLDVTGPGGTTSKQVVVAINATRYAFAGTVVDSDGGTASSVALDWLPVDAVLASDTPDGAGAWRFDDLVASPDQFQIRVAGR
ncbi:MAG: hypothetical protein PF961_13045 [Planctomycetota bacterium]|nr:hypothetical protein [Planctomycetota bacterium]